MMKHENEGESLPLIGYSSLAVGRMMVEIPKCAP
jgi:hypothetical protein